jgi:hypothetical protein
MEDDLKKNERGPQFISKRTKITTSNKKGRQPQKKIVVYRKKNKKWKTHLPI